MPGPLDRPVEGLGARRSGLGSPLLIDPQVGGYDTGKGMSMVKEFKEFLLRGNLLDLAVAVVIGVAFTAVVNAFVNSLITPLIKAIFGGKSQFNSLHFTIHGSRFAYGSFLNALLSFVIIAAVIFFLVIKPVNSLMDRLGMTPKEEPRKECPECLSNIPEAATRCAYCTSQLTPTAPGA
jgi:large conductance mechanosensitive channel